MGVLHREVMNRKMGWRGWGEEEGGESSIHLSTASLEKERSGLGESLSMRIIPFCPNTSMRWS